MKDYQQGYDDCKEKYANSIEGMEIGRKALKDICKHLETILPKDYKLAGVWQIAKGALKDLEQLS